MGVWGGPLHKISKCHTAYKASAWTSFATEAAGNDKEDVSSQKITGD